jgi:tetratricopeptide (TPR) repeat protein
VYTTWELSLKLLGVDADDHQKKTHFLTLAAFLGGHRVSKVLFKCYLRIFKLAGELKDNNHWSSIFDDSNEFDGTLFRDVVVELNELSLIRGFEETAYGALHFNVHSVVREWIVYRADTQSKRAFLTEAVDIMENFFLKFESDISWNPDLYKVVTHDLDGPLEDIDIGTLVGDMLQETVGHVRACIRLSKEIGPEFTGWRPVEKFFASVLCAVGDIEAALTIWERILEHYKAKFGESHGDVLMLMGVICSLKIQNGVTPEGIAALEALVTKMNYIQGSEHPTSLIWNVQLIQAYSELGQQTRTVDKMLELSEIFRQMKGKRTEPSPAARNLLPCLISYKHLDAAEDLLWEELQLCPEGDWSAYQFCQTALSNLLIAQNNISEAEECINDLIGLATEHFGTKDHPQIIGAEWTLSKCFAIQKRWKDAVATGAPFYQYVLKVLGPVHWITQEKALELAGYWINFKPADMTWPNATINMLINECTNLYGLNSNKTLRLRIRATDVYYKNGQYQLAFQLIKETRKIHCTTLDITDEQRIRTEDFCVKALGKMPNRKEEDVQFFADLHAGRLSNLEELLGEDNELTIRCRRAHATFLFNIDRFQSALPLYEKQRDILLKTSGDNSETYWDTSGAFANCLYRASKYAEAISLYERTLDWRKNSLDHNVEEDWDMRHWLACCYWKTGRYVEATNLFRDILDWKKRTYGPDDHRVFNTVRPQVLCFRESGQLEEAEKLCKILLDHDIRKSGETNEATIKTRTWLANIYDTAKKLAEAIEQFNILLERKTKQGLAEDPETNRIVARLASSLYDKEKYAEAEPYYRTNLAWRQKHRSTDYDGLILGTSNLAICLGKLNRYAEAVPYYKESATMKKAVYGADDERTMQALVSLGGTHILAGKPHLNLATRHIALQHFAEAIEPLSRAAEWTRTKNGPNVEITIAWVQILGDAYFGLGKLGEAKTCRSEVLLACEHLFGPYHGKTHHAVTQMRDVEMESGEFANAETYAVREMECLQREGADKQRMIEQAYVLGICRVQQGKYAEAEQDVAVCFAWKKEHLGLANHATIRTGYWHARCLEAFESYGAAVEHYELVVGWKGDVPPTWTKFQDDAKERLESCRRQAAMHGNIGKLKFSE